MTRSPTTGPQPLCASMLNAAGASRLTSMRAGDVSVPPRAMSRKLGSRMTPCDSYPRSSASISTSATTAASSGTTPAALNADAKKPRSDAGENGPAGRSVIDRGAVAPLAPAAGDLSAHGGDDPRAGGEFGHRNRLV